MTKTEDKSAEVLQEQEARVQTAEAATEQSVAENQEQKPAAEAEEQEVEAKTKAKESAKTEVKPKKASMPKWLEAYAKRYPSAKVLHVTGDRQVFLDKDYHLAKLHQKNLGQGKIQSYNI